MMNTKKVFVCADNFEAMMTCVYEAWLWVATENQRRHSGRNAQEDVMLSVEPIYQQDMFCDYIHIETDSEKAGKVTDTILRDISRDAYICVYYAAMSQSQDKLNDIYRFIRLGLKCGGRVTRMLTDPVVMRVVELKKRVGNEMHHFREFVRFNKLCFDGAGGEKRQVYISHIEPKSNIVYMVAGHFADRMPSEHWMIVDDARRLAVIHPADRSESMFQWCMTEEEYLRFRDTEKECDCFEDLWQTFFEAISIKERENYICQRNLLPLWMRKHMTEFRS